MTDNRNALASSERFHAALIYTAKLHAKQYRKDTDIPYISHLYSVACLVMEAGGNEDEVIGALLHDAAEDQGGISQLNEIRAQFGDAAADIVAGCTDDMPAAGETKRPWKARKEAYLEHLSTAPDSVLLVSNADKLHNARSILTDLQEIGEVIWDRFTASREETLWYYRSLAEAFLQHSPHKRLANELDRVVAAMEAAA